LKIFGPHKFVLSQTAESKIFAMLFTLCAFFFALMCFVWVFQIAISSASKFIVFEIVSALLTLFMCLPTAVALANSVVTKTYPEGSIAKIGLLIADLATICREDIFGKPPISERNSEFYLYSERRQRRHTSWIALDYFVVAFLLFLSSFLFSYGAHGEPIYYPFQVIAFALQILFATDAFGRISKLDDIVKLGNRNRRSGFVEDLGDLDMGVPPPGDLFYRHAHDNSGSDLLPEDIILQNARWVKLIQNAEKSFNENKKK
jgi:hypothetical protein